MKFKLLIIYITSVLLSSCSSQFVVDHKQNEIIRVIAKPDSTTNSIIMPYSLGIDSVMNEVLCISNMEMTKGKPESLLGNFVSDLCLKQFSKQADICIMNTGGLRNILPKGEITRGDIYKLMPFENELVVLELTENEFKGLLEYLVSRGGEPFSGMELKVKNSKIEYYFFLNNFSFKNNNKIKVLTSDYLANGGDKMSFFKGKEQNKLEIKLRDVIINYCISNSNISSKEDGRLTIIENE